MHRPGVAVAHGMMPCFSARVACLHAAWQIGAIIQQGWQGDCDGWQGSKKAKRHTSIITNNMACAASFFFTLSRFLSPFTLCSMPAPSMTCDGVLRLEFGSCVRPPLFSRLTHAFLLSESRFPFGVSFI